jgi:hypothetical protein
MGGGWEDRNGLGNEGVLLCCFGKGGWNRIGGLQTSWVRTVWWWTGRQYVQCSISSPCTPQGAPRASRVCRFGARAACRWREVRFRDGVRFGKLGIRDTRCWDVARRRTGWRGLYQRWQCRHGWWRNEARRGRVWWVVIGQELWSRGFPAYRQLGPRWGVSTFLIFHSKNVFVQQPSPVPRRKLAKW